MDRGDSYDHVVPDAEARHGQKRVVVMGFNGFTGSFSTAEVGAAVQRRKNIELERGTQLSNLVPTRGRVGMARAIRMIVIAVVLVALTVLWFLTW